MKKLIVLVVAMLSLLGVSSTAMAAPKPVVRQAPLELTVGPGIREIESPYAPALACLRANVVKLAKAPSFGIGSFIDQTGKVNYASESGSGTFMSQGTETMLLTSLGATGVQVTNMSGANRQHMDWMFSRAGLVNTAAAEEFAKAGMKPRVMFPDVEISGALTSLDFIPGGGASANLAGLKIGTRQNSILLGFDGAVTVMPFSKLADAGIVLTTFRYDKQIIGYENEQGLTSFFGGGSSRSLFQIDLGKMGREAAQRVARIGMDVVAYRAVRDVTGYYVVYKNPEKPVTSEATVVPYPWVAECDNVFRMAETDTPVEPARVLNGPKPGPTQESSTAIQLEGPKPMKALTYQPALPTPVQTASSKQETLALQK